MECNKEEAFRAKELAEKKMQNKDFFGAKKFALKAKQLFADIGNISQILTVCEVHCCASSKINGEMDWYGILQVEQTADDSFIKKQYRRLALQLHPDKNRFPGAEAAFKLIGEAHATLLDKAKRSRFDSKIRPRQKLNVATTFSKVTPASNAENQTLIFWTMCPNCFTKFQYHCALINAKLCCNICMSIYVATEMSFDAPKFNQNSRLRPNQNFKAQSNVDHKLKQEVPVSTKRQGRKDVDDFVSSKRTRKAEVEKKVVKENLPNQKASNQNEEVRNVKSFSSPNSEFYDFEKERDPKKFKPKQIWAVYDDQDAMPRFYVCIREVYYPFGLRFTWLEHNPQSEIEQLWANEGLPVACGNYRHGTSEVTKNLHMFSHVISWKEGTKRNTFDVYPKKGEIWALFRGWNDKWPSNTIKISDFEYELVEIISDCSDGPEFSVVHLVKVEGFLSLFVRSMDGTFQIPMSKVLMFSHMVHAHRCSKNEKEGVLEGSFELDSSSLPENFGNQPKEGSKKFGNSNTKTFYDFANGRSIEKFKKGQIWALYSNVDRYSKFYAKIRKVDHGRNVIIASWLEFQSSTGYEENWVKKGFPSTCGKFKVNRNFETFNSLALFSHIVHASSVDEGQYVVYPRQGEVWALYKDWSLTWTKENFNNCQYIFVEILEFSFSAKVRVLSKVDGYNYVFKPEMKGDVMQDMVIPFQKSLRFSHRIPGLKLTDEMSGALCGCWELDSAFVHNL